MAKKIFDILGIGIGPFNLGLACLTNEIQNLNCVFFDQTKEFNWHPGLMLENARLQVPFYADLVTLANPSSRFNYFSFLKAKQRLFRFAIHENYFITRKEYNEYCKWAIARLDSLFFGYRCEAIHFDHQRKIYRVFVKEMATDKIRCFYSRHIVIGIGTVPNVPAFAQKIKQPNIFHSSEYLFHREEIIKKKSIAIIGSGQSAAEIFYDLLRHEKNFGSLNWFTRSERFFPMDYSKFALEMTSPDYIDHFYSLDQKKKKEVLLKQNSLYKGINFSLITEIYDALYEREIKNACLFINCELRDVSVDKNFQLKFFHFETEKQFEIKSDAVILATGYKNRISEFLQSIKELVQWNEDRTYGVNRNYSIDKNNSIFVQNAELHSHGFNAADLGMGPYRNAVILNSILQKEHFVLEKNIAFQTFCMPK